MLELLCGVARATGAGPAAGKGQTFLSATGASAIE